MKNIIKVEVEYTPGWDEASLDAEIKARIITQCVNNYTEGLTEKLAKTIEELVTERAVEIIKDMDEIQLAPCSTLGIKESATLKQFITQKAIEGLSAKVNRDGKIDNSSSYYSDTKMPLLHWLASETIKKDDGIRKKLNDEISSISQKYKETIESMVTNTLGPVYRKLREQLK